MGQLVMFLPDYYIEDVYILNVTIFIIIEKLAYKL